MSKAKEQKGPQTEQVSVDAVVMQNNHLPAKKWVIPKYADSIKKRCKYCLFALLHKDNPISKINCTLLDAVIWSDYVCSEFIYDESLKYKEQKGA